MWLVGGVFVLIWAYLLGSPFGPPPAPPAG